MADVLGKVKRYMSEKITSVEDSILSYQEGLAASKIATAYTFIPCNIQEPTGVFITPVKLSTTSTNGVCFATTTVCAEVDSLTTFSAYSDLDAWAQNVAYNIGTLVYNGTTAYLCKVAHTSTTGGTAAADWATDLAAGYWITLTCTTFLKITHTAASSSKVANFRYKIEGYNQAA